MIVGSMFSGVGGFDLGLERAGHTIAWQCEWDEWRRRVLASRFSGVACYPDVRDLRADGDPQGDGRHRHVDGAGHNERACRGAAERDTGPRPVDLLCGGFPCQDVSVAGRRAGLMHEGGRTNLFFECARVADELLRPGGWLLLENVPGLLSSNGGRDYAVLLATLADLGFHDLAWRVLDSRFFGVAQRRRRVFIVARRARGQRAQQVLLEPEGRGGDPQAGGETRAGLTYTSALGTTRGGGHGLDAEKAAGGQLVTTARTLTANDRYDGDTEDFIVANALDRMAGVADDNSAQGNHLVAFSHTQGIDVQPSTKVWPSLRREGGGHAVLDTMIPSGLQGILGTHADAQEARSTQALRELREAFGAQAYGEWEARILAPFRAPEVLRSVMHGGYLPQSDVYRRLMGSLASTREAACTGWAMLAVREAERVGRTSRQRELARQLAGELTAAVPLLSQPRASAERLLHALWQAGEGPRVLREALSALEEMGRPADGEGEPAHARHGVRRLVPVETERLQGFPDDWTAVDGPATPDSRRYAAMGDAVTVNVAHWLGERLARYG